MNKKNTHQHIRKTKGTPHENITRPLSASSMRYVSRFDAQSYDEALPQSMQADCAYLQRTSVPERNNLTKMLWYLPTGKNVTVEERERYSLQERGRFAEMTSHLKEFIVRGEFVVRLRHTFARAQTTPHPATSSTHEQPQVRQGAREKQRATARYAYSLLRKPYFAPALVSLAVLVVVGGSLSVLSFSDIPAPTYKTLFDNTLLSYDSITPLINTEARARADEQADVDELSLADSALLHTTKENRSLTALFPRTKHSSEAETIIRQTKDLFQTVVAQDTSARVLVSPVNDSDREQFIASAMSVELFHELREHEEALPTGDSVESDLALHFFDIR